MLALHEQNKAIAHRFASEGWGTNPGWENVWDELMTVDVVYHFNSWAEPITGLDTNKAFNVSLFQGFPDIYQTLENIVAEGDQVVYRTTICGTHTGEFVGIPPTGKSCKLNDFTMLRITDGKIAEYWYECNLLELMKQLGLM